MASFTNGNGVVYTYTAPTITSTGTLIISGPGLTSTDYTIPISVGASPYVQISNGSVTLITIAGAYTYFDVPTVAYTYNIVATLLGSDTIHVGGTAHVTTTVAVASGLTLVVDGGAATFATTASAASAVTADLNSHGTFTISTGTLALLAGTSVTYGTNGGTFVTGSDSSFANISILSGISINNFSLPADYIDDQAIAYNNIHSYTITANGSGSETIGFFSGSSGNGNEKGSVQVTGNPLATGTFAVGSGPLNITSDASGNLLFDPASCFLRGTGILTADGVRAVEDLHVGDEVATRVNGETVFRPIIWVGHRAVDVAATGNNPDAYPVRIQANAIAANVPTRDLLVTSEHCILVDGRLIPVRMLVNGGSIIIDTAITSYEYFHIELEKHGILLAEGLTVESYLDTGNRGNFANSSIPSLRPDFALAAGHKSWATDAVAPLAVDSETVEPIWRALAYRSVELYPTLPAIETTDEPDLTVSIKGRSVRPMYAANGLFIFALPKGATEVRLVSRTSAPADTKPWLNDRRRLGVNVRQIVLRGAAEYRAVPLDAPGLSKGWWDIEGAGASTHRWTNGDAVLSLPALQKSMALLELQLDGGMTYVTRATQRDSQAA